MLSMTGYGQGSAESDRQRVVVSVRGVNHRFLDLSLRLPKVCRGSEAGLQRLVAGMVHRGRVELSVEISGSGAGGSAVEIDSDTARALSEAAAELRAAGLATGELSVADLLDRPDVARVHSAVEDWGEASEPVLQAAAQAALDQFMESRRAEGEHLAAVVLAKADAIGELVAGLEARRPEVQQELIEAQQARLSELLDGRDIDADRMAQEVALLIDKSNVSEELERLRIHVSHLRGVAMEEGAIGKRLDFLVQEVFRELNTLSAKCRSSDMTQSCVDAKVLCEEIREQLRNVE